MKKIILLCAGGMSTGVLVNNMKAAAKKKDLDLDIDAYPIESANSVGPTADCILLAPQVSYRIDEIEAIVDCPIDIIDMQLYGMMDGAQVLENTLNILERRV